MASKAGATTDTASAKRSLADSLSELKQRQAFRIAIAYAVGAWLVIQVAATILPAFGLPSWVLRAVILLAIAGFIATVGYFLLVREPEALGGWLGSRKKYWRVLAAGLLLAAIATAATWTIRGGILFGSQRISVAVLPFTDMSPGRDKAYFAEGVAEEILSTLAAEEGLTVLGRTTSRQIEKEADPRGLRERLGVTHLLEGSTRSVGNDLRVNVRLIDTSNGSQLWEEEYQGRLADVFSVQDQIAATVVSRIRGTFFSANVKRQARTTAINAYQTYLAARALARRRTEKDLAQALALAREVIRADPNYAPGHALLAELTWMLSDGRGAYGNVPEQQAKKVALPHARRAIQLAPNAPEGYAALGLVLPAEESIEPLKRAIALDPSRAELRNWLGFSYILLGHQDEALKQYRLATEIEPLWPATMHMLVTLLAVSGERDEALEIVGKFQERGGSEADALRMRSNIARWHGDLSDAIALGRAAYAKGLPVAFEKRWLSFDYALLGLQDQAQSIAPRDGQDYVALAERRAETAPMNRSLARRAWQGSGNDIVIFSLGARRDWPGLVQLHDARPYPFSHFCRENIFSWSNVALALRHVGRLADSRMVADCLRVTMANETRQRARRPFASVAFLEYNRATLAALDGDTAEAARWLSRAVDRGWIGWPYSSKIADYPQFDILRGDPRVATLQKRIETKLAKERAEVMASR